MMPYVITIELGKDLKDKIMDIKQEAMQLAGEQLYLMDEPHITLYLGYFEDISSFEEDFKQIADKIAEEVQSRIIRIEGWHVFRDDAITGRHTLVCSINEEDVQNLKLIQRKVVDFMRPYRRKGILKRYKDAYDTMQGIFKENLNKHGYPFVGDIWIPHISIGSIEKSKYDAVWNAARDKCPKGFYNYNGINFFYLQEETEQISLLKKFQFK